MKKKLILLFTSLALMVACYKIISYRFIVNGDVHNINEVLIEYRNSNKAGSTFYISKERAQRNRKLLNKLFASIQSTNISQIKFKPNLKSDEWLGLDDNIKERMNSKYAIKISYKNVNPDIYYSSKDGKYIYKYSDLLHCWLGTKNLKVLSWVRHL